MLLLVSAAGGSHAPPAAASSPDAVATHDYLVAQYRLGKALLRDAALDREPERVAAAQIAGECPGAVSGMPGESSLGSPSAASPRLKGENARLSQQTQTVEEELTADVDEPDKRSDQPAEEAFAAEVRSLVWSNPAIASSVQAGIDARLDAESAAAPPFCADARAWAQSGFRALSAHSREFQASQEARRSEQGAELALGTLLRPFENAPDRALIRKTEAVEARLFASAAASVQMVFRLARLVGFPRVPEEPKQTTLGHGRTAAGTRFEVSSGSGVLGGLGCHRAATVAYGRPGAPETLIVSGPNNPICLSSPRYRHPEQFCEAGLETIQTAVPGSVRSARLVLADGRDIRSRIVGVPAHDGGPAGIYAQQIRGSTSHAVSLVELDASRSVVLTVPLSRYRCVKPRHEQGVLPTLTVLAGGHTPEGQAFTISTLGSINGEPFLSVDAGLDPQLGEPASGLTKGKAFAWSLKLSCAPHPYAILYGFLLSPGESVVARTPEGAIALNVVPVEPRVRAKGPLVFGVFGALPSELTVLGANGSTVYAENLQSEATEAAQFCEGYAEP